jgi:hypothetical protein
MASLVLPPSGVYAVDFGYAGKAHRRSLKTKDKREALRLKGVVETTLQALARGHVVLPDGADVGLFVLSGGKAEAARRRETPLTLAALWDTYLAAQVGKKADNTLGTERVHRKHFGRLLGLKTPLTALTTARLQGYVAARAAEGAGPATLKKEMATLRMLLYRTPRLFGRPAGVDVREVFRGLEYPRAAFLPPFVTLAEARRPARRPERLPGVSDAAEQ